MIGINSNPTALMARNNLYSSQSALQSSMLKLSTGKRINSAADDAAGLQISNRMGTQISGLGVAQRNANDAISMAQTAEGAMQENTNIMNRMRDLSLQSANSSNTKEDRGAMQKEIGALITEVNRIADTTNFAGINLLDGSAKNMSFQIGSNSGETIEFGIKSLKAGDLKGHYELAGKAELSEKAVKEIAAGTDPAKKGNITLKAGFDADITVEVANGTSVDKIAEAINTKIGEANTAAGKKTPPEAAKDIKAVVKDGGIVFEGKDMKSFKSLAATQGDGTSAVSTDDLTSKAGETGDLALSDLSVATSEDAQKATQVLDSVLAQVDDQRANLGAVQNRLDSTISNLSNIEENLGVSQSRILDTDFAKETVNMTSKQMLMQAGSSILAQAKALPQNAARLLG